jgi:hypothetical protein
MFDDFGTPPTDLAHRPPKSLFIFSLFSKCFDETRVNFSYQQNRFNRSGYRFSWLNRRFPVISGFI